MSAPVVVVVEREGDAPAAVSLQAVTLAREVAERLGAADVVAVVVGEPSDADLAALGAYGVARVYRVDDDRFSAYGGGAWGAAVVEVTRLESAALVMGAATARGNEILAHAAASLQVAMAASVTAVDGLAPLIVTRQIAGGSALERARIGDAVGVLSVACNVVEAVEAAVGTLPEVRTCAPKLGDVELVARVARHEDAGADHSAALTAARVVVSGGRGAGGPDGFTDLLELAGLLGGALGVSRVVTSLGWRPHHEQVGQTGSRVAPDLYLACGISGAIQHWAGMSGSKTIVAVNTDPDAPMVTKAHYAVIGDLHQVVPAVNAEIRRRRTG